MLSTNHSDTGRSTFFCSYNKDINLSTLLSLHGYRQLKKAQPLWLIVYILGLHLYEIHAELQEY